LIVGKLRTAAVGIEYLQDERNSRDSEREDDPSLAKWEDDNPDDAAELAALLKLQDGAEGYAPDWKDGATLIADSYFTEYAKDLAEDCGLVASARSWPLNCIDWEGAADELKGDYTGVDFDGTQYWVC
jgi:hypothetical protein